MRLRAARQDQGDQRSARGDRPEELFDHVQQSVASAPVHSSPDGPVLRGLARCKRCHAKIQGSSGGRDLKARSYCSSHRANRSCDQPITPAERVEQQLMRFLNGFTPSHGAQKEILQRLANPAATADAGKTANGIRPSKSICAGCATSTN
jgi:Recombinase zinc beta ribbon domain